MRAEPVSPLRCKAVVAILLVALVPRLISLVRNPLIGADSSRFLQSAERFEEGDYRGMIDDSYHPLTASFIGTLNLVQNLVLPVTQDLRQEQQRREREQGRNLNVFTHEILHLCAGWTLPSGKNG